jgi:hypothetical protein
MRSAWPLLLVLLVLPALCSAQDNGGWWRQLFKPAASAPEAEAPAEETAEDSDVTPWPGDAKGVVPEAESPEPHVNDMTVDSMKDVPEGIRGSVTWEIPAEILALDSGRPEAKDIRIPGFRVQLFMGKLDSARQLKRSLELEELDQPMHVTPYSPLFGVTVGNFTTSLAAHRVREAWRPRFPNALVVPLDLPLDAVFPAGSSPAHGPHLSPTHRD